MSEQQMVAKQRAQYRRQYYVTVCLREIDKEENNDFLIHVSFIVLESK